MSGNQEKILIELATTQTSVLGGVGGVWGGGGGVVTAVFGRPLSTFWSLLAGPTVFCTFALVFRQPEEGHHVAGHSACLFDPRHPFLFSNI